VYYRFRLVEDDMNTEKYMQIIHFTIFGLVTIFLLPTMGWALPAFPGAVGFGSNTVHGRTGAICEVTNLNDSGAGSLRACVLQSGPRIIIFRISGTITLASNLVIDNPFVFIAGQTAPGGGITLRNGEFSVRAHDVLVQHIRVRLGDQSPSSNDAMEILAGAYNVVLDHISVSWGMDEVLSVHGETTRDVTISNSILSEGLTNHMGSTSKYANRISHVKNLYVHNEARNPQSGNAVGQEFYVINSVVYNWGNRGTRIDSDSSSNKKVSVIGNVYKTGTNSTLGEAIIVEGSSGSQFYVADNMRNGIVPSDPWSIVQGSNSANRVFAPPSPLGFTPLPVSQVQAHVLANAGARPTARDAVDTRIINDVVNGTGSIINSQSQVGGYPVLAPGTPPVDTDRDGMPDAWETAQGFNPNNAADGKLDQDGDGYTNVEEYLHSLMSTSLGGTTLTPPIDLKIEVLN
jgi:hypothetical protein